MLIALCYFSYNNTVSGKISDSIWNTDGELEAWKDFIIPCIGLVEPPSRNTRLSGLNNRNACLTVLEAGNPSSRSQWVWFLQKLLSLAGWWLPCHGVLGRPSLRVQADTPAVSPSSYKDTSHTGSRTHPWPSFNLNYLPEGGFKQRIWRGTKVSPHLPKSQSY